MKHLPQIVIDFSLTEIRGLLARIEDNSYTCVEIQKLTLDHLENIRRKIIDLQKLASVLDDMSAQCDGGLVPTCRSLTPWLNCEFFIKI